MKLKVCYIKDFENEILNDFQEVSFNKNAELKDILNYMFKNKQEQITKKDNAFLRTVINEIEKIINNDDDFSQIKLKNEIQKEVKNPIILLNKIENYEKLLKETLIKIEGYKIDKIEIFEKEFKNEINIELFEIDFCTFPLLLDKYQNKLEKKLSKIEIKVYLLYLLGKYYLESEIFTNQKKEMKNEIKEFIKSKIINIKIEKIYEIIENELDNDFNDFDETLFFKNVKKYIRELEFENCEKIIELDLGFKEIIDIINSLIVEKRYNWLELSKEESASVASYLYYVQNKK